YSSTTRSPRTATRAPRIASTMEARPSSRTSPCMALLISRDARGGKVLRDLLGRSRLPAAVNPVPELGCLADPILERPVEPRGEGEAIRGGIAAAVEGDGSLD